MISSAVAAESSVVTNVNFATTAGFYSQLAGVLAGFAFAGLIALVTAQLTTDGRSVWAFQSFVPLISAFIGLVSTSLNYSIIASDNAHARASLIETIAGVGFSVAGVMLFYSLLALLHGARADSENSALGTSAVSFVRRTTLFGILPLVMFLLYGGTRDNQTARHRSDNLDWVDLVDLVIFISVMLVVAAHAVRSRRNSEFSAPSRPGLVPTLAVIYSFISVVGSTATQLSVSESGTGPQILQVLLMLLLGVFVCVSANAIARFK